MFRILIHIPITEGQNNSKLMIPLAWRYHSSRLQVRCGPPREPGAGELVQLQSDMMPSCGGHSTTHRATQAFTKLAFRLYHLNYQPGIAPRRLLSGCRRGNRSGASWVDKCSQSSANQSRVPRRRSFPYFTYQEQKRQINMILIAARVRRKARKLRSQNSNLDRDDAEKFGDWEPQPR